MVVKVRHLSCTYQLALTCREAGRPKMKIRSNERMKELTFS
jgi:hypothetical protein